MFSFKQRITATDSVGSTAQIPSNPVTEGVIPFRRLRGVTWVQPGADIWVADIYLTVLGEPTDQRLWMPSVPCNILMRKSEYFEGVLKQQAGSLRAKVVLTVVAEKAELQVDALRKLFMFILAPPMDLNGPQVSKELFGLDGHELAVMVEMEWWVDLLEMTGVDDAVADLRTRIEKAVG